MMKSEVYSWRLSPTIKSSLEEAARREQATVAALLERIVTDWLSTHLEQSQEESAQRRLHAAAARTFGTIRGSNPSRSEQVGRTVRAKLAKRHAR